MAGGPTRRRSSYHLRFGDGDGSQGPESDLRGAEGDVEGLVPQDVADRLERLAARGEPLGAHISRLLRLLDEYGAAVLAAVVAIALSRDAPGAGGIAHLLEQRRPARGQRAQVPVTRPDDPRVRDLDVTPHLLERYDDLTRNASNPDTAADDPDPA